MTPTSDVGTNCQTIAELYGSLKKLCASTTDNAGRQFQSVNEQLHYLWLMHIPSFEKWYQEQFVPSIRQYEQINGKSAAKAEKCKHLAELYSKNENLTEAFEYINEAIRCTPSTDFLCDCYSFRAELHRSLDDDLISVVEDVEKVFKLRQLKERVKVLQSDTSEAIEVVPTKTINKSHYISIDSRIEMVRNEENRRFSYCATKYIPADENLINEQPVMYVLKEAGRLVNCSQCTKKCTNTFLPCDHCTEVIFCSETCYSEAMNGDHRKECGIIELMQREISAKSSHTYRLLIQIGHERLAKMSDSFQEYDCDNFFPKAQQQSLLDSAEVDEWFQLVQCELHKQLHRRSPIRTAQELTGAILLFAMYRYKLNITKMVDSEELVTQVIGILAMDLAKATLTQFNWHETLKKEQIPMGSFQCLFGGVLEHGCEPNATWSYYDGKLWIKSTKGIQPGQRIVISYGSFGNRSFYRRQEQLNSFSVACNCSKCALEVKQNFALRCQHCPAGPVPLETGASKEVSPTLFACMHCERPFIDLATAQEVAKQFAATQQLTWLMHVIGAEDEDEDTHKEYIEEISKRVNQLAGYIHPHYSRWLAMLADVCELFVAHQMFEHAVSWLQWLAERFEIYLACDKDTDLFERTRRLDLWTTAFTTYIEQSANGLLSDTKAKYITTVAKLFEQTFEAIEAIANRTDIDDLVENKNEMVQSMYQATVSKWVKFAKITQSKVDIPKESQLLLKYDEDFEFLVTTEEESVIEKSLPGKSQHSHSIDLSGEESLSSPVGTSDN